MAFDTHPSFTAAPTPQATLWRHLSIAKFVDLLQRKALFLASLERMAEVDPFEGTLPPSRFQHRQWFTPDDIPPAVRQSLPHYTRQVSGLDPIDIAELKQLAEYRIRTAYAYRRSYFISCWDLPAVESAAMWALYGGHEGSVAIISSEERFKEAVALSDKTIYGGLVSYGQYTADGIQIDDLNMFDVVLSKRLSFQYEQEYRFVYWDTSVTHNGSMPRSAEEIEQQPVRPGHYIACNVNSLISEVVVNPNAPGWITDVVKAVAAAFGLRCGVRQSDLSALPLR